MDEVDKIIIHTLHQIDDHIESTLTLQSFTPQLVVRAVGSCLQEIQAQKKIPNHSNVIPRTLPGAMAQRFTVASALAEACGASGYRGDIGYQTFLYPNTIELRRLLMFLIEQLPREGTSNGGLSADDKQPATEYEILQQEIRAKLQQQLKAPWVPNYCRSVANRRELGCSSQCTPFSPQLNLNVPGVEPRSKELQQYLEQKAPNIFQQTASWEYDLISSVLHKNDLERFEDKPLPDYVPLMNVTPTDLALHDLPATVETATAAVHQDTETNQTPLEQLNARVAKLRTQCDGLLAIRKALNAELNSLKNEKSEIKQELELLGPELKLHERVCLVLAEPTENVPKLEALIETTRSKRQTLEQQWQDYRKPLLEQLQAVQTAKEAKKNAQNVIELRTHIEQLTRELRDKIDLHSQLNGTLQQAAQQVAPRKEYTRRIHEFIGNIRKQRADIFKVLDDTRDLQKQLNLVGAQLQRQFNYTEDLLFQSAKHDLHAKKAYKLLANVHANCNELVDFVSLTGNVSKEIRDLEVQIDNEKMKNIATSLMQISSDIETFEQHIKELQVEIGRVENEITAG